MVSGSLEHPKVCAYLSPSVLDIAKPGLAYALSYSRSGPDRRPAPSLAYSTIPPATKIHFISSLSAGL